MRLVEQSFVPSEQRAWYRRSATAARSSARVAADFAAMQMSVMPGTDMPSAGVYHLPITAGERFVGMFVSRASSARTRSTPPRCAYLQTVVASLGTAPENARLFGETQRLLTRPAPQRRAGVDQRHPARHRQS